jgi:large subunit ribosomal protein L50
MQFVFSFVSETDTMFGGISAFPGSSTIVTGLKYKKKYKGYDAENPWAKYF